MASAISRIQPPSRPTAGSSSTSAATRSGRAAARLSATAPPNECPTTTTGPSASASSSAGKRGDVGVDRPRRRPRRPAVADQVRCRDRKLGQMPRRQRLPAPAVPGQAVDGQDPGGPGGSVTVHVQRIGHGVDAASRPMHFPGRPLRATCRTPVVSCRHVRTAHRPVARQPHRTRSARRRPGARRAGYGQVQPADPGARRPDRRGLRSRNRFCC